MSEAETKLVEQLANVTILGKDLLGVIAASDNVEMNIEETRERLTILVKDTQKVVSLFDQAYDIGIWGEFKSQQGEPPAACEACE